MPAGRAPTYRRENSGVPRVESRGNAFEGSRDTRSHPAGRVVERRRSSSAGAGRVGRTRTQTAHKPHTQTRRGSPKADISAYPRGGGTPEGRILCAVFVCIVCGVFSVFHSVAAGKNESAPQGLKHCKYRGNCLFLMVGASGFEPPTSWSRTKRSNQAEPRPENCIATIGN